MCTVCGCGENTEKQQHSHHDHDHDHHHDHKAGNKHHHYGEGPAHAHAPGMTQSRMVQIEQDILGKNNQYAQQNRDFFHQHHIQTVNLLSSPGSGKTTLLVNTLERLKNRFPISVIEGDQQTSHDADRIRETGIEALQINTGKGCHLDAHQIGHAVESLNPADHSLLFIENVGNLVCPAAFDLGESSRVVVLSITEGEDKPLKYPDMFHGADLMLLNKIDLLPHLDFNIDLCIDYARRINPDIEVLQVSATRGDGMDNWLDWLASNQPAILTGSGV